RAVPPAHPWQRGRVGRAAGRGRRALLGPALVAPADRACRAASPLERVFNRAFGMLVGFGLAPADYYLLEVKGRKSGRVYRNPVSLVPLHAVRYLLASRWRTQWIRDVEAT